MIVGVCPAYPRSWSRPNRGDGQAGRGVLRTLANPLDGDESHRAGFRYF